MVLVPARFEVDGVSSVGFIRVFLETDLPSAAGVDWGHLYALATSTGLGLPGM